jgi:DNA-binding response OmpR family regulator
LQISFLVKLKQVMMMQISANIERSMVQQADKQTTMQAESSILLIEDHTDIAEMVIAYLENRGFTVDYAADGVTGLHLAVSNDYDAIVLDLMLPGMDGLSVCSKLRSEARKDTPVIMLTARDTLDDKITGLETGADDYLIKPFAIKELEARLVSLIRRSRGDVAKEILRIADLTVDTSTLCVERNGIPLTLTPISFKILSVLMRASPSVVSRRDLERKVWGDILPDSDTLRSHLYNLRKVIDKPFKHQLLHTIQGSGYKIIAPDNV